MNICTFHMHNEGTTSICTVTDEGTVLYNNTLHNSAIGKSLYVLNKRDFQGPKEENVHKK